MCVGHIANWLLQNMFDILGGLFTTIYLLFNHKIQIMLKKQGNHTKANKSGEEAQKRNHGAYRYWAPSE